MNHGRRGRFEGFFLTRLIASCRRSMISGLCSMPRICDLWQTTMCIAIDSGATLFEGRSVHPSLCSPVALSPCDSSERIPGCHEVSCDSRRTFQIAFGFSKEASGQGWVASNFVSSTSAQQAIAAGSPDSSPGVTDFINGNAMFFSD